ncbi:MAG: Fe-S cluster assembly scaffold protein NifU [Candidatus Bathyarchaeia archaeon]
MSLYSTKVMEHFRNPRNMGEIPDADGVGTVGNPVCGDMMTVYIKVKGDVIEDIKFKTFGCGAAIATSSMITELTKGKTIEEALKVTKKDVVEGLGGLPPIKLHCSILAVDGLSEAIYEYYKRRNLPIPQELEERHEKTRREFEHLEKRYEEFLKLEKELI